MKTKILKCAMMSMLFLLSIFSIQSVHAEQYTGQAIWPSECISNIYIKKVKPDGYTKYQQAKFISIEDFQRRCKVSSTLIDKMRLMGIFEGMDETNQLSLF